MRNPRATLLLLLTVAALPQTAAAEIYLGITLQQGENGHPIVVDVKQTTGNRDTLAAFLKLEVGDEIYTAYSDPITLGDGVTHDSWKIRSISNLRWVLARTTSRVGVTVKRGDNYVKAVAVYKDVFETKTANGREYKVSHKVLEKED